MQKSTLKKHSVPGQLAGFGFQYYILLHKLSTPNSMTRFGLEIKEDVSGENEEENALFLGQVKHSTSKYIPFADNSKDLWNTFLTWAKASELIEIESSSIGFFLITNIAIPTNFIVHKISNAKSEMEINNCIEELQRKKESLPKTVKSFGDELFKLRKETIFHIIKNTTLCEPMGNPDKVKTEIAKNLHLSNYEDKQIIMDNLIGWVFDQTQSDLTQKNEPWIEVSSFNNQLFNIRKSLESQKYREQTKNLLPKPTEQEVADVKGQLLIRQLEIIDSDNEEIMDAIENYILSKKEKLRLSRQGDIDEIKWNAFENNLWETWDNIAKTNKLKINTDIVMKGKEVYLESMKYRGILAGVQTQEYYLSRGAFHNLANGMKLGWHPEYKKLLKE